MAKLRDSLFKLREHLDTLQKKKDFLFDSDSENNLIRSNGAHNSSTRDLTGPDEYPVLRSKVSEEEDVNNNEDNEQHSDAEETDGNTSPNESDATSNGTSQRGTNDRYVSFIVEWNAVKL